MRYVRNRKDYNTLDYSDVTYGNVEGQTENVINNSLIRRNNNGKSNLPMGRGLLHTELKPEQYLPTNVLAKLPINDRNASQRAADFYKNRF